jgi:hypothetical protein
MTWQRIDENTYIDDTLVTCAEYQLFIDEMREQGKYYQPDHWTSYQYPAGQARDPILGVRHSDAIEFCEWLTQREGDELCFRLPNMKETRPYSLSNQEQQVFGFWIRSIKDKANFVIIDDLLTNPRKIQSTVFKDLEFRYKRASDLGAVGDQVIHDWAFDISVVISRLLSRDLNTGKDRMTNIDEVLDRLIYPNFNKFYTYSITDLEKNRTEQIYINNLTVDRIFKEAANKISESIIYNAISLDLSYAVDAAPTIDRDLYNCISTIFAGKLIKPKDVLPIASLSQKLIIDLFTLQERIAGRSPAFEGIRLVKEWIR